jgi:hypothetical protein
VRRAALLAAGCLVAPLAGCGGDDEPPASTARTTTTTVTVQPVFTREAAEVEAQSVAAQEAARRDFSYPPTAFAATCSPRAKSNGRPRFACRTRSPKGSCNGTMQIVQLADGSLQPSDVRYRCRGRSNI